jgi:hypothetical protein
MKLWLANIDRVFTYRQHKEAARSGIAQVRVMVRESTQLFYGMASSLVARNVPQSKPAIVARHPPA